MINKDKISLITGLFKTAVEKKYKIVEIKLFGSSARNDFSKYSDIDILVILHEVNRRIEEDLFSIAYDLELEYDCLIDVIVLPKDINYNIPLYQNIIREGKPI